MLLDIEWRGSGFKSAGAGLYFPLDVLDPQDVLSRHLVVVRDVQVVQLLTKRCRVIQTFFDVIATIIQTYKYQLLLKLYVLKNNTQVIIQTHFFKFLGFSL